MKNVTLFDTSIASRNVGDQIIMQAVQSIVSEMFSESQLFSIPSHNYLSVDSWKCLRESNIAFVGGTNLLSSNMPFYQQWKIHPLDLKFAKTIILMGVGWWQYQERPNWYTRYLLKKITKGPYLHSVRDDYTAKKLQDIGIENVVNTGCPSMWGLTPEYCENIPWTKGDSVVFTLTDYKQSYEHDRNFIKQLRESYDKLYFWVQGSKDIEYVERLGCTEMLDRIIPPRLSLFDQALEQKNIDYIGTRLHAGIRALQKGRRTLILAVDNRAAEIKKDFNLNVIERSNLDGITDHINANLPTELILNSSGICLWKEQFS